MAKRRKHVKQDEHTDPMAALAPAAVFEEKEPTNHSGVEVVQTFFSKSGSKVDPGVNPQSGLVLDHRNYVKTPVDGEGKPLVEFRWGSRRPGFPERNARGGYVPARINEKGELDPAGRMVEVGGMTLLVRKSEHGEVRRKVKEREALAHIESSAASQVMNEADRLGIADNVKVLKNEVENKEV